MISKPFFETACYKCGCVDEAKFVFSTNGAVKQVCLHCGAYIKFFNKSLVPTTHAIKEKIWYIAEMNLELINMAKKQCEFIDYKPGLAQQLQYWKLYLTIRNYDTQA